MRKRIAGVLCALTLMLSLSGCGPKYEEMSTTIFAMDTVMNLTLYHAAPKDAVEGTFNGEVERIYDLERKFSATREGSDIHNVNANGGEITAVSTQTADVLRKALALCEQTGGALDVTAYSAVTAWGFTTGDYRVPSEQELSHLTGSIDYTRIELLGPYSALPEGMTQESIQGLALYEEWMEDGELVYLPAGMELDLGAVAKGYAGDRMAAEFRSAGLTSALLDLGQSTIAAVGAKPDGSPWRIGIQDPHGDSYLGVLELNDQAMGSSGNYQRYFEENGKTYGHIIDPDTAAPADSGLAGVTVVADSAFLCDGLSTALYVMGLEKATEYWREYRDFEAIFITEAGEICVTSGLEDVFSLADGYTGREVTILA